MLIANGYYKINKIGFMTINKPIEKKVCVFDSPTSQPTKKDFVRSFVGALSSSIDDGKVFFCVTHKGFMNVLEKADCKILIKIPLPYKQSINGLYKYWECPDCSNCRWKDSCYGNGGKNAVGEHVVREYVVVCRRRK